MCRIRSASALNLGTLGAMIDIEDLFAHDFTFIKVDKIHRWVRFPSGLEPMGALPMSTRKRSSVSTCTQMTAFGHRLVFSQFNKTVPMWLLSHGSMTVCVIELRPRLGLCHGAYALNVDDLSTPGVRWGQMGYGGAAPIHASLS